MLDELKTNLANTNNVMKKIAYQKQREESFDVRELVYLRLRPYRVRSLSRMVNEKLPPQYFGPYKILQDWSYGL